MIYALKPSHSPFTGAPSLQHPNSLSQSSAQHLYERDFSQLKPQFQLIFMKYTEYYNKISLAASPAGADSKESPAIKSDGVSLPSSPATNSDINNNNHALLVKVYIFKVLLLSLLIIHDYFDQSRTLSNSTTQQQKDALLKQLFPFWEDLLSSNEIQEAIHYHYQYSSIGRGLFGSKQQLYITSSHLFLLSDIQNCYWKLFPKLIIDNKQLLPDLSSEKLNSLSSSAPPTDLTTEYPPQSLTALKHLSKNQSDALYQIFPAIALSSLKDQKVGRKILQLHRMKSISLKSHVEAITCMTLSQGRLYTGSKDSSIKIWDIIACPIPSYPIASLQQHKYAINCLVICQGYLYSGSDDCHVFVWNVTTSPILTKPVAILYGHTDWITKFLLHTLPLTDQRDAKLATPNILFSASADNTLHVWNLTIHNHSQEEVISTVFNKNAKEGAASPSSKAPWEAEADAYHGGGTTLQARVSKTYPLRLFGSPAKKRMSHYSLIVFRDPLAALKHHKNWITCLAVSKERKLLFSGSYDHSIKVYNISNIRKIRLIASLDDHMGIIYDMFVSEDRLYSCSGDWRIKIWDVTAMQSVEPSDSVLLLLRKEPNTNTLNKEENSLQKDTTIEKLQNEETNDEATLGWSIQPIATLYAHRGWVSTIAISLEYGLLFSAGYDHSIFVWEISSFPIPVSPIAVLRGHKASVLSLVVNQHFLYSGSCDKTIKVWDISILSLHQRQRLQHPRLRMTSVTPAFSPSAGGGSLQGTATSNPMSNTVSAAPSSPPVTPPPRQASAFKSLSVAPDYAVYEVIDQKPISTITGHKGAVNQLLVSHGKTASPHPPIRPSRSDVYKRRGDIS